MTGEDLVNQALKEIGTRATGSNKTDCKYTRWYFGTAGNRPQSVAAWCAIFIQYCMDRIGAGKLIMDGRKTASCITMQSWFQSQGQYYKDVSLALPGDILFFDFNKNNIPDHAGIFVRNYAGTQVESIDGNTSSASQSSGGTVARRRRSKDYVIGIGRVKWGDGNIMTQAEFETMFDAMEKKRAAQNGPAWLKDDVLHVLKLSGISDTTRPMSLCTRAEVMQMMYNLYSLIMTK